MSFATLFLLAGCGANKPFVLMEDGYKIKPSSIAIVAGDNSEPAIKLAEVLTKEIKEKTAFRIMDQDDIRKRIPKYPMKIETTEPKDSSRPVWFVDSEKKKLDSIQGKLKVDYIFVIWAENLSVQSVQYYNGGGDTNYYMTVIGNLIEYPKGKTVSFTHIDEKETPHLYKLTIFKSNNYFVESMINDAVQRITEDIVTLITAQKG